MKLRFRGIALLMLVVLTLTAVLGACADGKGDVTESDAQKTADQTQTSDAAAQTGEAIAGGEITVGVAQELDSSLDPHEMVAAGTAGTREILFNIFEGLLKPDSDGNLIPAVASAYKVDGAVYTFTVREGVTFHNGQAVTAADVVYSLQRVANASSVTTYVSAFSAVTRIEEVDSRTVEVELQEPDSEFDANFTVAIIPAGYGAQSGNPVGTGPFRFVSYAPQESLVMERYDDYWGEAAYLDKVTFQVYASSETMIMALQSGALDLCAKLESSQVTGFNSEDFSILEGTMNLVQALYLNNEVAPFNDVRVRQALCYAVDIEEIMQVLADGRGTPVGSSMYPAFAKYYEDLSDAYPYDPDQAKALLEEAGYGDGFTMTITVPANYQPHVTTAQVIVEQLGAVGITATIDSVEWTTWYNDVYTARNYEATVIGVDASFMTARAMLARFDSAASNNFTNFSSAEYDAVYAQAQASTGDEQIALYKRLQEILSEEAANVYLQDMCNLVVMNSKLAGFLFYPLYAMDLSTVHFTA